MGGIIIIIGIISGTILWADLKNVYIWTLIFVSLSLGALGLLDDILKIVKILVVWNRDINFLVKLLWFSHLVYIKIF